MTFDEMLLARESCRRYSDELVSREDLLKIADAGRLSPSACNSQPWRFIIVDEPEAKQKVCDALMLHTGDTGAVWRDQAGAFILMVEQEAHVMPIVERFYGETQVFAASDIGMATMNMMYKAMELGLGTCVIGVCEQEMMEEAFGIPHGDRVRLTLAIGHVAEQKAPRKKVRKSLEEVCSFNHF